VSDSRGKRQQRHIPGTLNGLFHFTLAPGTIAASLARVYLAAMGQQFRQGLNVLIIDILLAPSAKTTLRLLPRAYVACFSSSFPLSFYHYHSFPVCYLTKNQLNPIMYRTAYLL
jgi:hypothetical protein